MGTKLKPIEGMPGYFDSGRAGCVTYLSGVETVKAKATDYPDQVKPLKPTPQKEPLSTRYSLVTKPIAKLKRKFWPYAPKHKMKPAEAKSILFDMVHRRTLPYTFKITDEAIATMVERGLVASDKDIIIIAMERDIL